MQSLKLLRMNRVIKLQMLVISASLALGGCAGRTSILPNSDPDLRKLPTKFSADAAKRHYETEAPRGGPAPCRAEIEYMIGNLSVVNLSDTDWHNVELWVNQKYVVYLPNMEKGVAKTVQFEMIFDGEGTSYSPGAAKENVKSIELFRDGKMWTVTTQLPDK